MLDDFLIRATLAGIGVALAAAPLGCFVVWRRMAFFGDATAHAAILGVALALAFEVSVFVGVMVVSLAMAATLAALTRRSFAMDTLLAVLAHSALAFGLVAMSFLPGVRMDLIGYLFGDILAVGRDELLIIWIGALLVIVLLWLRWSRLLTATLNPDLAFASGIQPRVEQFLLTLGLAIVVAVALQVVGALLIASLLIIPAATARSFARDPEIMAVMAAVVAVVATTGGLRAAYLFDTPTGPTIVAVAATLFALSGATAALRRTL